MGEAYEDWLSREHTRLALEINHLNKDIADLKTVNKSLNDKITHQEDEIKRYVRELEEAENSRAGDYEIEMLEDEVCTLNEEVRDLKDDLARLENQNDDLNTEIRVLEEENERLAGENDELKYAPWPEWAESIKNTTRHYSGYDGFDDEDGVNLPQEVADQFGEFVAEINRLRKQLGLPEWA